MISEFKASLNNYAHLLHRLGSERDISKENISVFVNMIERVKQVLWSSVDLTIHWHRRAIAVSEDMLDVLEECVFDGGRWTIGVYRSHNNDTLDYVRRLACNLSWHQVACHFPPSWKVANRHLLIEDFPGDGNCAVYCVLNELLRRRLVSNNINFLIGGYWHPLIEEAQTFRVNVWNFVLQQTQNVNSLMYLWFLKSDKSAGARTRVKSDIERATNEIKKEFCPVGHDFFAAVALMFQVDVVEYGLFASVDSQGLCVVEPRVIWSLNTSRPELCSGFDDAAQPIRVLHHRFNRPHHSVVPVGHQQDDAVWEFLQHNGNHHYASILWM